MVKKKEKNTYQWLGWDNVMPSLVWLRQMADKQEMERKLKIANGKWDGLSSPDHAVSTIEVNTKMNCVMQTQKLIMLFLIIPEPRTISLPLASLVIFGPVLSKSKRSGCLQRLGEICQVLQSVGLIKKVMEGNKKGFITYQYVWEKVSLLQGEVKGGIVV